MPFHSGEVFQYVFLMMNSLIGCALLDAIGSAGFPGDFAGRKPGMLVDLNPVFHQKLTKVALRCENDLFLVNTACQHITIMILCNSPH